VKVLPNGNLLITAGNLARQGLADAYRDGGYAAAECFVGEYILPECGAFIPPENIGALTDSPIVCLDADYPDDGIGPIPHDGIPVYWFPNYQVVDPWELLKNTGRVIFTKGEEST